MPATASATGRAGGLASHTTPALYLYIERIEMVITDIIAFAKNGVSPADMKDLIANGYTAKDIEELLTADVHEDEGDDPGNPDVPPDDPEPAKEKPASEKTPDYKSMYEAEKKRREDLERAAAHKQTDDSGKNDDFSQALESVQSFL